MTDLSESDIDILQEIINIGIGAGANALNNLLSSHIALETPKLKVLSLGELTATLSRTGTSYLTSVMMPFTGTFSGSAALVFPDNSAVHLVRALVGDEFYDEDMDSMYKGVITEIGNIVLNGVMGTISNLANSKLHYSSPNYFEVTHKSFITGQEPPDSIVIFVETIFKINTLNITGSLVLILEVSSMESLIISIRHYRLTDKDMKFE